MKQTAFTWNDVTPAVLTRRSLRYTPPQLSFSSLGQTVAVDLHAHPNVACVVAAVRSLGVAAVHPASNKAQSAGTKSLIFFIPMIPPVLMNPNGT
jgi:hypothetical protein